MLSSYFLCPPRGQNYPKYLCVKWLSQHAKHLPDISSQTVTGPLLKLVNGNAKYLFYVIFSTRHPRCVLNISI